MLLPILFDIVAIILRLLIAAVIANVVLSWLYAFDIISRRAPMVEAIWRFTSAVCNPFVRPIRRVIPPVANVDLSPLVLLVALGILESLFASGGYLRAWLGVAG
jgi:YggT family protein